MGIERIVLRFRVISSPTRPSPRVAPRTKTRVLVKQRHAEPVHLGFTDILEIHSGKHPLESSLELLKLGDVHGVVQREHGDLVLDGGEGLHRLARNTLGRAVGRDQVGVPGLEILELSHETIVLGVGNLGLGQDVIEVVVAVDELPELRDASGSLSLAHHGW